MQIRTIKIEDGKLYKTIHLHRGWCHSEFYRVKTSFRSHSKEQESCCMTLFGEKSHIDRD